MLCVIARNSFVILYWKHRFSLIISKFFLRMRLAQLVLIKARSSSVCAAVFVVTSSFFHIFIFARKFKWIRDCCHSNKRLFFLFLNKMKIIEVWMQNSLRRILTFAEHSESVLNIRTFVHVVFLVTLLTFSQQKSSLKLTTEPYNVWSVKRTAIKRCSPVQADDSGTS